MPAAALAAASHFLISTRAPPVFMLRNTANLNCFSSFTSPEEGECELVSDWFFVTQFETLTFDNRRNIVCRRPRTCPASTRALFLTLARLANR